MQVRIEALNMRRQELYAVIIEDERSRRSSFERDRRHHWTNEQRAEYNNHQNNLIERTAMNPIGARYDIDVLSYKKNVYYDVGQCSFESFFCHALGFEDENKDKKASDGTMVRCAVIEENICFHDFRKFHQIYIFFIHLTLTMQSAFKRQFDSLMPIWPWHHYK